MTTGTMVPVKKTTRPTHEQGCRTTLIMPDEFKVHRNSKAVVEEPSPCRDIVLEVLDEMNRPPRRTFGDFSRAYCEQCAKDGTEPECPF